MCDGMEDWLREYASGRLNLSRINDLLFEYGKSFSAVLWCFLSFPSDIFYVKYNEKNIILVVMKKFNTNNIKYFPYILTDRIE